MFRLIDRLRRRLRGESGMTLVELMIAMGLLGVVIMALLGTLASVQRRVGRESDRSLSNDQARLAVEELDRELRSGNVLYDPNPQPPPTPIPPWVSDPSHGIYPGMSLLIYTQTNANTRTPNPGFRCVQWRAYNQQLQRRDWTTEDPAGTVTTFRVIADHIVNAAPNYLFTLDPTTAYGGRLIDINLIVNQNPGSGQNVGIKASVEGRDTQYGYPVTACSTIPPY